MPGHGRTAGNHARESTRAASAELQELRQVADLHIRRLFEALDPRVELGGLMHRQRFVGPEGGQDLRC